MDPRARAGNIDMVEFIVQHIGTSLGKTEFHTRLMIKSCSKRTEVNFSIHLKWLQKYLREWERLGEITEKYIKCILWVVGVFHFLKK